MQWFITNMILLLIELLLLVECGYQQTRSRDPITRAERQLNGLSSSSSELWSASTETVPSPSPGSGAYSPVWNVGHPRRVKLSMKIAVWWCFSLSLSAHAR
jgi:hypothetical protein